MSKISDEIRKITKRYRDWLIKPCKELDDLADRIDAEMVELPKDAHGEYIRVGDTVYLKDGRKGEVSRITLEREKTSIDLWMCDKGRFFYSVPRWDMAHTVPDSLERIADDLDDCDNPHSLDENALHHFADRIRKLAKERGDE